MNTNKRKVVDTKLILVVEDGPSLLVYIALSQGGWIEHEPFWNSPEGLVGALMLAADVNAGKFYPRRFVRMNNPIDDAVTMIESQKLVEHKGGTKS